MMFWGKLLGGVFGYMLGGIAGALFGLFIGHFVDKAASLSGGWNPSARGRIQQVFFSATFSVMGHVAKADGRVTKDEIRLAEAVMQQMRLSPEQMKTARDLFTEGKGEGFDLDAVLVELKQACRHQQMLLRVFLEIQLQAALADSVLHEAEKHTLLHIFQVLGFSARDFEQLIAMIQGARAWQEQGTAAGQSGDQLASACEVLGVSPEADNTEIKKAYRKLMNQHHPDKLVAKGLPEEMIRLATEKTHEIRTAYDTIRKLRGF